MTSAQQGKWCWVHQTFTYKKSFRVKASSDIGALMQVLHGKRSRKDPDKVSYPRLTNTVVEYEKAST